MIELKPCPFHNCLTCACVEVDMTVKDWNTRPIEDALTARIAELESGGVQIQYMSEDELPENISSDVYSAMFGCSKVDFIRLFPFVTVDGRKLFLIELPEVPNV